MQPAALPNLFIIGAAKAGTTSLYEYLRGHPEVYMSPVKEPAYFSPDMPPPRVKFEHGRDEARYLELFAAAPSGARRIGEASTSYLPSRRAPELIAGMTPQPWIVAMLRNPIDTMHSLHGHRLSAGTETIADFAAALDADLAEDRGGPERRAEVERGGSYRDRTRYADQLPRWLEAFGDRVKVIIFEEFFAQPRPAFAELLRFLEVDDAYQPPAFAVHNPRHERRRGPIRRLLKNPLATWVARTLLPRLLGVERTARLSRRFRHSAVNRREIERAPIDAELRARLQRELTPDVERLGELLGRDLKSTWWS